jgi:hypothetical protein
MNRTIVSCSSSAYGRFGWMTGTGQAFVAPAMRWPPGINQQQPPDPTRCPLAGLQGTTRVVWERPVEHDRLDAW